MYKRQAPAIGICAGYGIYVLARQIETEDYDRFLEEFRKYKEYLDSSRPTAVNLSWALNRMENVVTSHSDLTVSKILKLLEDVYKRQDAGLISRRLRVCLQNRRF